MTFLSWDSDFVVTDFTAKPLFQHSFLFLAFFWQERSGWTGDSTVDCGVAGEDLHGDFILNSG